MTLDKNSRKDLVELYLEKSDLFINEVDGAISLKMWSMATNRLYYSLLNATRALLVRDGFQASTHDGVKTLFGKNYVVTGEISIEFGKLFSQMETLRERADYDCCFKATEKDVNEKYQPVKDLISRIKGIIASRG